MTESSNSPLQSPLASVEAELFGSLFGFHKKTVTLLRESNLDDEQINVVGDRIKTLLANDTAETQKMQRLNVTERLEAAFDEVKRLVDVMSVTATGGKGH